MELVYPDTLPPLFSPAGEAAAAHNGSDVDASQMLIEAKEILPIVDPNGYVVGRCVRRYCHSPELRPLHPVVHLHLLDGKGGLYLQKRSLSKLLLPGYWDTAVGGHISYGESVRDALNREADEEIGVFGFNPIHILTYVWESAMERELVNVFAAVGDFAPVPDKSEVSEGRFWSFQELEDGDNLLITPNFKEEYSRISNQLKCLSTSNSCCE